MSEPDLATVIRNGITKGYYSANGSWIYETLISDEPLTNALNVFFKDTPCDLKKDVPYWVLKYVYRFPDVYTDHLTHFDPDDEDDMRGEPLTNHISSAFELLDTMGTDCPTAVYNLDEYIREHPEINNDDLTQFFETFRDTHSYLYEPKKDLKKTYLVSKFKNLPKLPEQNINDIGQFLTGKNNDVIEHDFKKIRKDYDDRFSQKMGVGGKRKTYKRKLYKRKSYKRKFYKRKSYKRKSY
jgi:hypothetical protein